MIRKIVLIASVILFFVIVVKPQSRIDSLKLVLEKSKQKSALYNQLAEAYKDSSVDEALRFSKLALDYSKTENNEKEKAAAFTSIGTHYLNNCQYDSAMYFFHNARALWEKLNSDIGKASIYNIIAVTLYYKGEMDSVVGYWERSAEYEQKQMNRKGLAVIYNNIGVFSLYQGNHADALISFQKSLEIKKELNDIKGLAYAYNNIGQIYDEWGETHKAIEVYQLALDYSKEIGDKYMTSVVLNNTASNYKLWSEFEKSLEYYQSSLKIKREIDDQKGIANLLNNIASVYEEMNRLEEAKEKYIEAQKIYEAIGDKSGLSVSYSNIGSVFNKQGKPLYAIPFHKKSLEMCTELQSHRGIVTALHGLGKDYFTLKDYENAKFYLKKSIDSDRNNKYSDNKLATLLDLTKVYQATREFDKALTTHMDYTHLKDSIFSEKKHRQVTQLHTLYETEKKDKEIELQQLNISIKEAALRRERSIRYGAVSALIVTALFLAAFLFLYIQKLKAYKVLFQQNLEIVQKERLILSLHETRTLRTSASVPKYTTSLLTDEQKEELLERVNTYMVESKSYLNSSYTIEDMAAELGTNRRYLSQIINEKFGVNFNSFINELRIKEARRMLVDPKFFNLSLQGIAESVGFLSRASFNDAFKKFTGLTPSYFQKLKVTA